MPIIRERAVVRLPLRSAYLCTEPHCQQIMDGVPSGVCRFCGSSAVRAVAELLLSAEERQAWSDLVRGRIGTPTQPAATPE